MAPRRRTPARRAPVVPRPRAPPPPPRPAVPHVPRIALGEPPHAHIVCRSCGRISPMELVPGEGQQLIALADRHPDGWTVNGIAFSLTGVCPACAEGRSP